MIFQHMCSCKISPKDAEFARKALCTPDLVDPETDCVIGQTDLWDSSRVEIRLCGIPGQPAFMAAAVFRGEELFGFARSETYRNAFDFRIGEFEYLVTLQEDETLDKETPKASANRKKHIKRGGNAR